MRYFILFITILFLASCGTEAEIDQPETETVRIGSFDVVTNLETGEAHADWVGQSSPKMKTTDSDTTWFDSPDGQSIVIKETSFNETVTFTFRDSTYTIDNIDSFSDYELTNPLTGQEGAWGFGFHDDFISAVQNVDYDCEKEYDFSDEEYFEFRYIFENTQQKVHFFNVNGMIDAIDIVMCHSV